MHPRISGLVVKIAQRCNLNCTYCYMYHHADQSYRTRPVFMSEEVFRALVAKVAAYSRAHPQYIIGMTFHGGEPMMFDPKKLDRWLTEAGELLGDRVKFGMQTNATMVTDEWLRVLARHRIQPGVSLDGPADVHDAARVDHGGRGSFDRAVEGLRRLADAGLDPGVLCVINPRCSGLSAYHKFRSLGFKRMNFLFPEVTHDTKPVLYGDLGPTPVADYLIPIFEEWWEEDDPEVRIRLFIEAIRMMFGATSQVDTLGGLQQDYLIVDTDGSIQGNDCLKICYEGAPETGLNILEHGFDDLHKGSPLVYQLVSRGLPLSDKCLACSERAVCGGSSVPQRYSKASGFLNPSVWCDDLFKLLSTIRSAVESRTGSAESLVA